MDSLQFFMRNTKTGGYFVYENVFDYKVQYVCAVSVVMCYFISNSLCQCRSAVLLCTVYCSTAHSTYVCDR